MPIIERIVGKKRNGKRTSYKTAGHMKNIIIYVTGGNKTEDKLIGCRNLINKDNAYNEFVLTKMMFDKMPENEKDQGKRMIVHFVQSFDVKDTVITYDLAKRIADEFADSTIFKNYQVLYAVHKDTKHIHTHFIVNTTNINDGSAWQQSKQELEKMKQLSDRICLKYGISIIEEKEKGKHKENGEHQAEKRGASWKKEIFHICKEAKEKSSNIEEYVRLLKEKGVEARIVSSRKDITYFLGNKKINSDKLGFPKRGFTPFTKEELAKHFAKKLEEKERISKIKAEGFEKQERSRKKEIGKKAPRLTYLDILRDIDRALMEIPPKSPENSKATPVSSEKSEKAESYSKEESKKAKGLFR